MKLYVTDKVDKDLSLDEVLMSVNDFIDIANQPYISSSRFDVIYLDVDKRIPDGLLKVIVGVTKVIPIVNLENITLDTVRILSDLYPEFSSRLRWSYMKKKDELPIIVKEIMDTYKLNS